MKIKTGKIYTLDFPKTIWQSYHCDSKAIDNWKLTGIVSSIDDGEMFLVLKKVILKSKNLDRILLYIVCCNRPAIGWIFVDAAMDRVAEERK
jgi:hypothetical protein